MKEQGRKILALFAPLDARKSEARITLSCFLLLKSEALLLLEAQILIYISLMYKIYDKVLKKFFEYAIIHIRYT